MVQANVLASVRDLCAAAGAREAAGCVPEGLALVEQALDLCRRGLGEDHYAYAQVLVTRGWLLHAGGEVEAAAEVFGVAEVRGRGLAENDFENARAVLTHVFDYRLAVGDQPAAAALMVEMVGLHERYLGEEHPRTFAARAKFAALAED